MPALDDALPLLRCPLCGGSLASGAGAVRCSAGHAFDIARQGYLSLLSGEAAHTGDTPEMVAARERFLGAGHFDRLADELASLLAERPLARRAGRPGCLVDLGAGTGWYLARLLDAVPAAIGLALDVSKPALRRAAKTHPRLAAVACDVWRPLPLMDAVAAAVVNVFAPRNPAEMTRVLGPGGLAAIVTPRPAHLRELVAPLGLLGVDESKDERLAGELASCGMSITARRELDWTLALDRAGARDAAAMGPSAFHLSLAELDERVAALPQPLELTAAVTITLATAAGPRGRPPAPAAAASGAGRRRSPPASRSPRSPGGKG